MSIKVYEAYRFPVKRLSEFLEHVHREGLLNFAKQVKEWRLHFTDVTQVDIEDAWSGRWGWPRWSGKEEQAVKSKWEWLERRYRQETYKFSSESTLFHVQAGWRIWVRGRYAYTYPWGFYTSNGASGWVEDYSYWDNTDPPAREKVSAGQWRARARFWNHLFYHEDDKATTLDHMVIDFSQGQIDTSFFVEHYLGMYVGRRINEETGQIEEYNVGEPAQRWRVLDVDPGRVLFQWQGLAAEWMPCEDWRKFLLPYEAVPYGVRPDQQLQAMIDTRWRESAPVGLC